MDGSKLTIERLDAAIAEDVRIDAAVTLVNHGTLSGRLIAAEGVHFIVVNDGTSNAVFDLSAPRAELRQYISSAAEITRLDVRGGAYIPTIGNFGPSSISASALLATFDGPIVVDAAMQTIDVYKSELPALAERLVILNGVWLNVLDSFEGAAAELEFNGRVVFIYGDAPRLYGYNTDGEETRLLRETDFTVILGKNDKRAGFLNALRARNPSDKILEKLDRAPMAEMNAIMGRSMYFNPLVLNERLLEMTRPDFGVDAGPGSYTGTKAYADGAGLTFGFHGTETSVDAGFRFAKIAEDSDYKYGRANVLGASLNLTHGDFGIGGELNAADWRDVLLMSADGGMKTSAFGRLFHGFFEYRPLDKNVGPIIRMNYVRSEIAAARETSLYPSAGFQASFASSAAGIKDRFGAFVLVRPARSLGPKGPAAGPVAFDAGLFASSRFIQDNAAVGIRISPFDFMAELRVGF